MARNDDQPIILRGHVRAGNGGYRPYEGLSDAEKKAFGRKAVERMGKAFTDHCTIHPEAIPRILTAGEKKSNDAQTGDDTDGAQGGTEVVGDRGNNVADGSEALRGAASRISSQGHKARAVSAHHQGYELKLE